MAWGGNPVNSSIIGLRSLLGRPAWQGTPELVTARSALRDQLESPNKEARMLASNALVHLFDADERQVRLAERLRSEQEPDIQEALLGALFELARIDPLAADKLLEGLSGAGAVASIDYHPDEAAEDLTRAEGQLTRTLLDVFTLLAISRATPYASRAWADWMAHPVEAPATVRSLIQFAREAMKSRGAEPDDAQRRAFAMTTDLTERVIRLTTDRPEEDQPDQWSSRQDPALSVAHVIAVELYFASGAFVPNVPPEVDRERQPSTSFVALALPVLERLATVPDVATAHQVISTLVFLARAEPRRSLMAITGAALGAPGYEREQQGEEAMFELFDGFLTNNLDDLLNDDECLTRIRIVLERYVDLGSTPAINQLQRLSRSFR